MTTNTNALASKAVLANVTIRRWAGRRLDRKITDEVNKANDAEDDAGRFNKLLIPKKAFEGINHVVRAARTKHYVMTLPWQDEGSRILPSELIADFTKTFQKFRIDFEAASAEFAKEYPRYLAGAKKRLGKMYNAEDFPDPKSVRGRFSIHVRLSPVALSEDFRIKAGKELLDDLRRQHEEDLKQALADAMKDPITRIVETVGKLSERLKNYKPGNKEKGIKAEGTFRDSLIENIKELLEILPAFNLTGDAKLTALTARIAKEITVNDAQKLRDDPDARKSVVKSADAILKQAESLLA